MRRHTPGEGAAGPLSCAQFLPQLSRHRAQQLLSHVVVVDLVVGVKLEGGRIVRVREGGQVCVSVCLYGSHVLRILSDEMAN